MVPPPPKIVNDMVTTWQSADLRDRRQGFGANLQQLSLKIR